MCIDTIGDLPNEGSLEPACASVVQTSCASSRVDHALASSASTQTQIECHVRSRNECLAQHGRGALVANVGCTVGCECGRSMLLITMLMIEGSASMLRSMR
ncbi:MULTISPECIES: hypothetical protein [unclassified Xanthomonas]|uniref:hypothetical protein n=1 Tax=unclassified Xanthomonas TaxID=2643310 RepID=UPI002882D5B5|nr:MULTISPECIES: hypothetical protein [unclassified Xanthomonas]